MSFIPLTPGLSPARGEGRKTGVVAVFYVVSGSGAWRKSL